MIPKIIHFVWLGNNEKPDCVLKCMESWKKYCPDYTIMEWSNESLKEISNVYVHQAVEHKKWAFASDYIRLKALYEYGGIYVDTDLEITNALDSFLNYEFVSCAEDCKGAILPMMTAFIASAPCHHIIQDLLAEYDDLEFIKNGELDMTPNTIRFKKYFKEKYGIEEPYDKSAIHNLEEGAVLLPASCFCLQETGKENYAIHHFEASWRDPYNRHELISLGRYRLVKFKRRENIPDGPLPIKESEEIVFLRKVSSKRFVAVLRSVR